MNSKEQREFLRREQELSDLRTVMSLPEGRRYLWRILGEMNIFSPCFSPEQEGARRQGLNILAEIQGNLPVSYLTMQKEAMDEQERQREIDNRVRDGVDDDGGGAN
jgi:hypothetical protein